MVVAALTKDDLGIETFADELQPGTRLLMGQFTIESFLSAGGFGITYVARNSLDRQVVIKECFPSAFCRRKDYHVGAWSRHRADEYRSHVELFLQEALNLAKLDHPNIVRVHQVFQDNDTAYMAMDYIRGPDLLQTVEGAAARLTPDQIMSILGKLLDALAHVHGKGYLHRDISPDNILLDETTGEPVLIDFGAARKDETRRSRALSGLRVVKDGYSPQEFYIAGSDQAPCSDLYALAASFSHLITGEPPKTSRERLSAIANRQPDPQVPLVGRVRGYPAPFLAAIDKAMSIFPRDRLKSVADWLAMLDRAIDPPSATATAPVVAQAPAADLPQAPPRRRLGVLVVTAAVLGAGLAGEIYNRFLAPEPQAVAVAEAAGDSARPGAYVPVPTLQMPYVPDPDAPDRVAALLPWSPGWMRPGQRIVEVNGKPVQDGAALPDMLGADVDLAAYASYRVIFGYQAEPGGEVIRQVATLPVVHSLRLPDGLAFDIRPTATGVETVVTALPVGGQTTLQIGDVLQTHLQTGERLDSLTALTGLLGQDRGHNGIATYSFAVQRDGAVVTASFVVNGES